MSRTNGPDLSDAVSALADLMDDDCAVYATTPTSETVLQESTGRLVPLEPESTVYTGRCMVRTVNRVSQYSRDGGRPTFSEYSSASVPLEGSEAIREGHILIVTSSRRDAGLVGRRYRVTGVSAGTLAVTRKLQLEEQR